MTTNERRYRCCPHCAEDPVHDVPTDGHEIPCNAPKSRGCVGKEPTPPMRGRGGPQHD